VTDYRQLLAHLKSKDPADEVAEVKVAAGRKTLVGYRAGYAVFAEPRHRDALRKAVAPNGRVAGELAPLQPWLDKQDAAIVLTSAGVRLPCYWVRSLLAEFRDLPGSLSGQDKEETPPQDPRAALLEAYDDLLKRTPASVQFWAIAARIDGQGNVHLESRLRGAPATDLAKALTRVEPPQRDLLSGFPARPFVVAGGGVLPEKLMDGLKGFAARVNKAAPQLYGVSPGQADRLAEVSQMSAEGLRGMSLYFGVGEPDDAVFGNLAMVMTCDDSVKYLRNYRKYLLAMNETTIEGTSALKITMKLPRPPQPTAAAELDRVMGVLFGAGGDIVFYLAAADQHTVVLAYTSKERLLECVRAVRNRAAGLHGESGVAQTAALLMPNPHWVGYWSQKGSIDFINRVIVKAAPPLGNVNLLPDFPDVPPIGLAAKAGAGELHCHLVVPATTIRPIGEIGVPLIRAALEDFEKSSRSFSDIKNIEN
jgi:hypothetical protein